MKALSIKHPSAWLICAGIKDVENRTWSTNWRVRIYVHASLRLDRNYPTDDRLHDYTQEFCEYVERTEPKPFGAIIGEVDIVACFHESQNGYPATKSPWFTGPYGLVLANPELYETPIPCKGRLAFFEPDLRGIPH